MVLQKGCTIWVPATTFDNDDEIPWSEAEFGADGATKLLDGCVIRIRAGKVTAKLAYDGSTSTIDPKNYTHDAATCGKCQEIVTSTSQVRF
jgi:hypothetical protein